MYNRVFKNYQVNVGNPFQIKTAVGFNAIKPVYPVEKKEELDGIPDEVPYEDPDALIAEAREEAESIIKEARHEAEKIIREALEQLKKLKVEALEEARKKGYEDGVNEGRQKYEKLIKEAELIKEKAKADYDEAMAGIEADAVELIVDIAKKVICSEIKTGRKYILHLLKEAIEKCTNKETIVLRVSAEDYDYVENGKDELLSMVEGMDELEVKKDFSLKEGSCIVETQYGSIDAGVQTKIEKIEEALRQTVGR